MSKCLSLCKELRPSISLSNESESFRTSDSKFINPSKVLEFESSISRDTTELFKLLAISQSSGA